MWQTLRAEYPTEVDWSKRLWNSLFLGAGVTFLVGWLVTSTSELTFVPALLQHGLQYGAVTVVGYAGQQLLEDRLRHSLGQWLVWHELLGILLGFLLIGLGNYATAVVSGDLHHRWADFWHMQKLTFGIGFLPVLLLNILGIHQRLRRRLREAERLNRRAPRPAPLRTPDAPCVQLPGAERPFLARDFCFAESNRNYLHLHFEDDGTVRQETLRMTLTAFVEATAGMPTFFRSHRAFVVNLERVTHVAGNAQGFRLSLRGTATEVPVSRSRVQDFRTAMQRFDAPQLP